LNVLNEKAMNKNVQSIKNNYSWHIKFDETFRVSSDLKSNYKNIRMKNFTSYMNKIIAQSFLQFLTFVLNAQIESSKVGIRPLPRNKGEKVNGKLACGNYDDLSGQYPFVSANMFSVKLIRDII
jgi:hypothetical protein